MHGKKTAHPGCADAATTTVYYRETSCGFQVRVPVAKGKFADIIAGTVAF